MVDCRFAQVGQECAALALPVPNLLWSGRHGLWFGQDGPSIP